MDNLVITVARGFGSCGKRIAKQIADDLGIHCYENRILMLASQMSGLDEEVFAEVNEKLRNQNVFSAFLKGLPMQRSPKVCLLYTSPSPRDLSTSRMPSSA